MGFVHQLSEVDTTALALVTPDALGFGASQPKIYHLGAMSERSNYNLDGAYAYP